MDGPQEIFRSVLKEIKASDSALTNQVKFCNDIASKRQLEATQEAKTCEQLATSYLRQIQGQRDTQSSFREPTGISAQMHCEFETLKRCLAQVQTDEQELQQIYAELRTLRSDLQQELEQEAQESLFLECKRKKRLHRRIIIATAIPCLAVALYFWILNSTILTFALSLDGNPPSSTKLFSITLDAKPFASGDHVPLGRHTLSVVSQEYEPLLREFRAFYGNTDLGVLTLKHSQGGINIISHPPDAEYQMIGNGQEWHGKLPALISNVPVGMYQLITTRKGWSITNEMVAVNRNNITTNTISFLYGSIEVVSEPTNLIVSVNGIDSGRTPTTIRELKPGQYKVVVIDGDDDRSAELDVGPNEALRHDFAFHYGRVQVSSTPPGAFILRKRKEVGKTPLILERIPNEPTPIELRLDGYVSTNFEILSQDGAVTSYPVRMFSYTFLAAMDMAQQALDTDQFEKARTFVKVARESDPAGPEPLTLLAEINQKTKTSLQLQVEKERVAATNNAESLRMELSPFPLLSPEEVISNCWKEPAKSNAAFSDLNALKAARSNPVAVPVAAATDVGVKIIEVIAWPFNNRKVSKESRFDAAHFLNSYQNKPYRYYGKVMSIDTNSSTITFATGGTSKQSYCVLARFHKTTSTMFPVEPGLMVWIAGRLISLEEANTSSSATIKLVLDDGWLYPPDVLKNGEK
jgi:hypothetical protein